MLISEAIAQCTALTGQVVANSVLVRWLSELDGRLAIEFYRTDAWTPYDPTDDLSCELLVPFPWDGIYIHHLAAQTYFSNSEYDRYENERVMSEKVLTDFRAFMQRTQSRLCGCGGFPTEKSGGTYVTVIPEQADRVWYWISAYSIAVKHGFHGTEEEWLDSLVGPPGPQGPSGIVYIEDTEPAASAFAKAEAAYGNAEIIVVHTESDPLEQTLYLPCVLYQPNGIGVSQGVFLFSAEASGLQYQLILTESQWSPLYTDSMIMSSGGGMTGPLSMGSNRIKYLATPTADSDAATKGYVDDEVDVVKSALNAVDESIAIRVSGNKTTYASGAAIGQYVIVDGSTITGITDGLYKASKAIPYNTVIDSTYLTAVSGGGLNSIMSDASTLRSITAARQGDTIITGGYTQFGRIVVVDFIIYLAESASANTSIVSGVPSPFYTSSASIAICGFLDAYGERGKPVILRHNGVSIVTNADTSAGTYVFNGAYISA